MHRLGTLSGLGTLRGEEGEFGKVSYTIVVWRKPGGIRGADGTMSCEGNAVARAIFSNKMLYLDLEDGNSVNVLMTQSNGKNGDFAVSGPVPGFQ